MKARLVFLFLALSIFGVSAEAQETRFAAAIDFVRYAPSMEDWDSAYDEDMQGVSAALAYTPNALIELGVSFGYYSASGQGVLPMNNSMGGDVDFTLMPVEPYITLVGRISENQWLVPYIGGGYSQVYYRLETSDQEKRKGKAHGHHTKAGLRFLLDRYDPGSANRMLKNWGIESTALSFEVKKLDVEKDEVDLGGNTYLFGLVFSF